MATWLEMRCEARAALGRECWSARNDGPMLIVGDANADVLHGMELLRKQAEKMGWTRTRQGWFCPGCVAAHASGVVDGEVKRG